MGKDKKKDQKANFAPDLFITPSIVMLDKTLQPLDKNVYSIIYWFEKLKDGRCFASNATIAKLTGSSSSGVANAIVRLKKAGHIQALYDEKGHRKQIITLVGMSVNPYSNEEGGVTQMSNIIKNTKKEYMSDLTEERKSDIRKVYGQYLISFKIDPRDWDNTRSDDERKLLLDEASKSYRLTDKRKATINRRLDDCGMEMVLRAVKNCGASSFHRGDNDRGWVAGLDEFILRSYEKVEEWSNKFEEER